MQFGELVRRINVNFDFLFMQNQNCSDIRDVMLIDGEQEQFSTNILYFGYSAQVKGETGFPPQCVLASEHPDWIPDPGRGNNLALVAPEKLFSAFNLAQTLIRSSMSSGSVYKELLDAVPKDGSIKPLLNLAARLLENPVVLIDSCFKIVAYSTVYPVTDPVWADNISRGYCTYDFIKTVMEQSNAKTAPENEQAYIFICSKSPVRKLSSNIVRSRTYIGNVTMLEEGTPISQAQMNLLPVISRACGEIMSRYSQYIPEKSMHYREVLYCLIIGAEQEDLRSYIEATGLLFPKRMCVLAIKPSRDLRQSYLCDDVVPELKNLFPEIQVAYHEDYAAVLVSLDGKPASALPAVQLADFAGKKSVHFGVSRVFSGIEHFAEGYRKARKALELAGKLRTDELVSAYEAYSFYDMLDHIADKNALMSFCHPALKLLSRYDRKNGTELYKTLKQYLDCSCNIEETSEAMFLHRNSICYRLGRIKKICDIDLNDNETKFLLSVSFRIDRYAGNPLNESSPESLGTSETI